MVSNIPTWSFKVITTSQNSKYFQLALLLLAQLFYYIWFTLIALHRLYPIGAIYGNHWKGKTPYKNVIKIFIIIVETHVDIPNESQKVLFVRISY